MKKLIHLITLLSLTSCVAWAQVVVKAPTNLTATAVSTSQINLTWTDNATNEVRYIVERSTNGTTFSQIDILSSNSTSYQNTGLTANTKYYYRVKAVDHDPIEPGTVTSSAYSNTANATTLTPKPSTPKKMTVTVVSSTQLNADWEDTANNETGFELERSTDGTNFSKIASTGANVATYQDKSLNPNTKYFYRARAVNAGGASGYSTIGSATTQPAPIPNAPVVNGISTNWTKNIDQITEITINWQDKSSNETGFDVEWGDNNTFSLGKTSVGANVTQYKVTDHNWPGCGGKVFARVRSKNAAGNSAYSEYNIITAIAIPEAPNSLTATAKSTSQIDLAWNGANESYSRESEFIVQYATSNSFSSVTEVKSNMNTNGTSITGLNPNTKYFFRVKSKNCSGDSPAYSNIAEATTQALPQPPNAPVVNNISTNWTKNIDQITEITINWQDKSSDETGFDVEWGDNNTFSFGKTSVGANVTEYKVTDRNWPGCGGKVFARVRSKNAAGNSGFSETNATTAIAIPEAPNSLTATTKSTSQIDLAWNGANESYSRESEFIVQYATSNSFSSVTEVKSNMNTNGTSITGLNPNTKYFFRVKSKNCSGDSPGFSNTADATTQAAPQPPNAPVINGISMNWTKNIDQITEITINWQDKSSDETGFEVEWGDNNTFSFGKTSVGANVTEFKVTDRNWPGCGGKVFARVRSKNAAGNSGFSETNATTAIAIPEAPNSLTATAKSSSQIDLAWNGANESYSRESEFIVQYATSNTFSSVTEVKSAMNTNGTSITGLNPNTKYFFRVKSRNCSGDSPGFSSTADATTQDPPVTKPSAPTKLTATTTSSTEIKLVWTDASDNETGFDIERSTDNSNFGNTLTTNANTTTFAVTGLNPSTKYFFRVRAKNSAGNSDYSNTADATTQAPPVTKPTAPTKLTATTTSSTEIKLVWTDASDNETGFDIERSTDNSNFGNTLTANANTTTFAVTGLNPSTKYFFRVRAKNSAGNSDYSNTADATTQDPPVTKPTAPTKLTATTTSSTEIKLVWTDASDNETGFDIERSTDNSNFGNTLTANANTTTFAVTGLNPSTKYFFRVRAKNSAGNSDYSNTADAKTQDPPVTSIKSPTNLRLSTAQTVNNQLILIWDDNSGDETAFELSRSTNTNNAFEILKADIPANTSTYTDKPVRSGNKYFYRVRAIRNGNFSNYSNVLEANAPLVSSVLPLLVDWTIFPNPVSTSIRLELEEGKLYNIIVLDQTGNKIKELNEFAPKTIETSDLPSGTYFLKVSSLSQSKTFKIIKQ